jgi:alpha-glucosidase
MPEHWAGLTAAAQQSDPDSTLHLYRRALSIRRSTPDLQESKFGWLDAPPQCLSYRRGGLVVVLNAGDSAVPLPVGDVLLASGPLGDGVLPANTAVWLRA